MKRIIILGSTGSIGRQTLEVVRKFPREFEVVGLSGGKNWRLLEKQIREFRPQFISTELPEKLTPQISRGLIFRSTGELIRAKILPLEELAAKKCDLVVSAIAGVAGLPPTLEAIRKGRKIALANKESLVLAGSLVMAAARKSGAKILPIDSEHSAVWQLLEKIPRSKIRKIILTASGGALRDIPIAEFKNISPAKVLQHPTWKMGRKITLDCATMANKAFEIIEAAHLFNLPLEKISAVIHPQSFVHALVETIDGNIFAQISKPDMRLPIQIALFGGERRESLITPLDLAGKKLEFHKIEKRRYPLFFMILEAAKKGGIFPAAAAAASEVFGEKFLAGEIKFPEIAKLTKKTLESTPQISRGLTGVSPQSATLENILATVEKIKNQFE
ncbi:1-deoxy-D-xylulose-5-phosphate reductoisomerase [Patescibacteria group bacterium]|nr:1-deoxy-D-xylulose-5-phosphate reductoisomerase [Patescibacteria group bacterium]